MTTRLLLSEDGDALLIEPGSWLLWEPEFPTSVPAGRTLHVAPKPRTFTVPARQGIWVPPRTGPVPQ